MEDEARHIQALALQSLDMAAAERPLGTRLHEHLQVSATFQRRRAARLGRHRILPPQNPNASDTVRHKCALRSNAHQASAAGIGLD